MLLILAACGAGDNVAPDVAINVVKNETIDINSVVEKDSDTGISIRTYFTAGFNVHAGYFNTPLYVDETSFYFVADAVEGANVYLYSKDQAKKVSLFSGMSIWKDANKFGLSLVASDDALFYTDGRAIYKVIKGSNSAAERVFLADEGDSLWAPLHVTRDGGYVSVTLTKKNEPGVNYICRISVGPGLLSCLKSPLLGSDKPYVDHAQIHPQDPNIVMFAHDDSWVNDRIWIWDIANGVALPKWLQPAATEVGHEFWFGENMDIYAVQYGQPAYNIPSGLVHIRQNGDVNLIGLNYTFYLSHASMRSDQLYFVADTYRPDGNGNYWLVLYDMRRDMYLKVTKVPSAAHPAHGHPSWSPSGDKIQFTGMMGSNLVIKEVSIADILAQR